MSNLPVICEHCGKLFYSKFLKFDKNITNLTLFGNLETCPHCKKNTGLLEGNFNIHDGIIEMLDGPHVTVESLRKIQEIIDNSDEETAQDDVEKEIERATGEQNFIRRFSDWAKRTGYLIDNAKEWRGRLIFIAWLIREFMKIVDNN